MESSVHRAGKPNDSNSLSKLTDRSVSSVIGFEAELYSSTRTCEETQSCMHTKYKHTVMYILVHGDHHDVGKNNVEATVEEISLLQTLGSIVEM